MYRLVLLSGLLNLTLGLCAPFHYHEHGAEWIVDCPDYCAGLSQSPINIVTRSVSPADRNSNPLVFEHFDRSDYSEAFEYKNNGHALVVNIPVLSDGSRPAVSGGGLPARYLVQQFHFHWGSVTDIGSEHTIDGKAYDVEGHFVSINEKFPSVTDALLSGEPDALAVFGILFPTGTSNSGYDYRTTVLPTTLLSLVTAEDASTLVAPFPLQLAAVDYVFDGNFYRYAGSLTTPKCNEQVVWTVFENIYKLAPETVNALRALISAGEPLVDNYRATQPLNGRQVTRYM